MDGECRHSNFSLNFIPAKAYISSATVGSKKSRDFIRHSRDFTPVRSRIDAIALAIGAAALPGGRTKAGICRFCIDSRPLSSPRSRMI